MHAQLTKDLGTDAIITLVGQMSKANVGIHSIHAILLKFVGTHFFHQADASSFLIEIDHHTLAGLFNHLHGPVQLFATIATLGGKDVTRGTR